MSCLLTEAIEQEGEADPLGEGNPSFLFRSEVSEVSGFDLTDANVLLETGGTVVTAGFDWNQGTKTIPLCGALATELPKRGKDFPTMPVLGAMEEGDSSKPSQDCESVHLVDKPPTGSKVKYIPNPIPIVAEVDHQCK